MDRSNTHAVSTATCVVWTILVGALVFLVGREIGEAVTRLIVEHREVVGIAARTRGEFMGGL